MLKVVSGTCKYLKENEMISFLKSHKIFVSMIICIFVGMLCGSILVGHINLETLHQFDFLFLNDFKVRTEQSLREVFVSSLASYVTLAFIFEFFAMSILGVACIGVLSVFKGFGMGLAGGYLYLIYGLKGIAFYILILLPGILLSSIGLALFAANSFDFSLKIFKKILPNPSDTVLWQDLKPHFRNAGYSLIILLISAFIDMCFMGMFSRFFKF